jgi:TolB-like protein
MHTRVLAPLLVWLGVLVARSAGAEDEAQGERVSIAVMDFSSKGGLDAGRMEALTDMLSNSIRQAGDLKVVGKSDIGAVLSLEENKKLLGCDNDSCMAELGGALGVRYLVSGNLSLFGQTYLLNLKLLDVRKVEIVRGVSRSITGTEDALVAALPEAARELVQSLAGPGAGRASVEATEAEPEGYFVAPGHRKGRMPLALGVGLGLHTPAYTRGEVAPSLVDYQRSVDDAINDVGLTARLQLSLGYNFLDWLTLSAALGADLGGHVESDTERKLAMADLSLQLLGAFNQDSWIQPVAYLGLGLVLLWDKHGSLGASDDSVEGKGIVASLGVGANLYLTSRLVLGLRAGGRVNGYVNLGYDPIAAGGENLGYLRLDGLQAWSIAVELSAVAAYEF